MLDLFNVLEKGVACKDLESGGTACANLIGTGIPGNIVSIIHYLYNGIQIIVPLLLIIFGMIDLAKAITAQKEDEIKKAQAGLLKKAVVAIIVFLVFSLVQFVTNFAGAEAGVMDCVSNLIHGTCSKA